MKSLLTNKRERPQSRFFNSMTYYLNTDQTWIIHSLKEYSQNISISTFYVTPTLWSPSPFRATMLPDEIAAKAHIKLISDVDYEFRLLADGGREYLSAVTLKFALAYLLNDSSFAPNGDGDASTKGAP